MDILSKYIFFQAVIIIPFILGQLGGRKFAGLKERVKIIIRMNLICIEPVIVLWSIWGLHFYYDMLMLPAAGFFLVGVGLLFGRLIVKLTGMAGKRRATFLVSSSLSNHGFTMGGFICYMFLGEKGLGLMTLFLLYFTPYLFLVVFPYANQVSKRQPFTLRFFMTHLLSPQNMPLAALILGLIFIWTGVRRPDIRFPIDAFLATSISIYFFSLGLTFELTHIRATFRENLYLGLGKFLLVPLATFLILQHLDLDRDIKLIIAIESCMPAAVYSVITSILFDLDARLASGLFVLNTAVFIVLILPPLLWVVHMLY